MANTYARELRRNMTQAERRLWSAVRGKRLLGLKFRRQQPIGPLIVDFVFVEAGLIIELDGAQHHDEEQFWYDYRRTKFLETKGYRVMRFNNSDVLKFPAQVIEQILSFVQRRPPSVSPLREERSVDPPSPSALRAGGKGNEE